MPILVHHPLQDLSSSVIIEVGIDIRKRYTVRIKETLEEEVIFQRVNLRDAKTVGHDASCRRATSRANPYSEFLAGRVYEILYDEEVSGETHRLHDMQLKAYTLVNLF